MSTTVSKRLLLRLPIIFFKGSYNYNSSDKAPVRVPIRGSFLSVLSGFGVYKAQCTYVVTLKP